jgi:hypothetical protein
MKLRASPYRVVGTCGRPRFATNNRSGTVKLNFYSRNFKGVLFVFIASLLCALVFCSGGNVAENRFRPDMPICEVCYKEVL